MTRSKTLTLLALAGALAGCSRPTQQESTYRLNLENKFSWQGPGPDIRWYWPWYTMHVVSHQQEIQTFPLIQGENARIPQIELEKLQSIITADGQIMIQEMSITIYKKADPTAVERFYIQHQKQYDSAQNEADRRESKLRSMQQLSAAVGSNNDAANYLTSQILNDLLEQTPSKNVGRITVLNGLSGSDQAIFSRQGVLQGK